MSKFDEPEPGAVSNSVKHLAAILGLYAATFFVLEGGQASGRCFPLCQLIL